MVRGTINPGPKERIRVLVIDDQAAVVRGLQYVLLAFDDLEWMGQAESDDKALELCATCCPDVVLMDPLTPGIDALGTMRRIRQQCERTQVIVLARFGSNRLVKRVLEAGAASSLVKYVSAEELAEAIRAAHTGQHKQ